MDIQTNRQSEISYYAGYDCLYEYAGQINLKYALNYNPLINGGTTNLVQKFF